MHIQDNRWQGFHGELLRSKKWWPIACTLAIILAFGWRYDRGIPGYGDRVVYGSLMFILIPTLPSPFLALAKRTKAPLQPFFRQVCKLLQIEESIVEDLRVLLILPHVVWNMGFLLILLEVNDWLAKWLERGGGSPDRGTLIVCLLLVWLTLYHLAANGLKAYLARRRWTEASEADGRIHVSAEASWFFGLLALALIPAALRASVVPNLLLGLVVPIIVFYWRAEGPRGSR